MGVGVKVDATPIISCVICKAAPDVHMIRVAVGMPRPMMVKISLEFSFNRWSGSSFWVFPYLTADTEAVVRSQLLLCRRL